MIKGHAGGNDAVAETQETKMSAALMMANRLRGKDPKFDSGARPFTSGLAARLATWPARPR